MAAPTSLTWSSIVGGAIDQNASNNPVLLNNTGNVDRNIEINSTNLRGETESSLALWAGNFSASNGAQCRSQNLTDHTFVNITSATLPRGNFSINNGTVGQEQIYVCLNIAGSELTAQSYSTANETSWTIRIVLVALSTSKLVRRKKKKKPRPSLAKVKKEESENKKSIEDDRLVQTLDLIIDELKDKHNIGKEQLEVQKRIEVLIKEMKDKHELSREDVIKLVELKEKKNIPITIFINKLGVLESLVKYLKENLNMNYKEISRLLERDERTIWTSYNKAVKKQKEPIVIKETNIFLPIEIFKNRKFTPLEAIISYLRERNLKFSEIAELLQRDQRNIQKAYSNVIEKKKRNL